jgi:hypothetical protein
MISFVSKYKYHSTGQRNCKKEAMQTFFIEKVPATEFSGIFQLLALSRKTLYLRKFNILKVLSYEVVYFYSQYQCEHKTQLKKKEKTSK